MKSFTFLMHNIYAMGGTVKAVTELANTLSNKGHKVNIISVFQAQDKPYFEVNDAIHIKTLIDYRVKPQNIISIMMNRLNTYTPFLKPKQLSQYEPGLNQFSKYVEHKMIKAIQHVDTDVLVGTRASFNILISKYHHTRVLTIGMEHMNLDAHPKAYQEEILKAYNDLDIITTLTSTDRQHYEQLIDTPVYTVPNIINVEKLNLPKSNNIISAGRLEYEKGFDILIEAIRRIQDNLRQAHFKVDIYGDGQQRQNLEQLIQHSKINDLITIHPATPQLNKKLAQSKVTVVPSRNEGFGMVVLEALAQDNVVISFKDTLGPASILSHGENGYLANYSDPGSLAKYIDIAINHIDEMQEMIQQGHDTVANYSSDAIYTKFINAINRN
ncbi:glycosyltransferase family 4 protein [Staphylococcus devriesei]|uniref:glycosyltransferase family 4 protein n=1 Tax=Staphylococcus devriesei TaxID=586733 RepID=UPI000E69B29F|nr:glycosyltransferase family 4 protein [Staphylococcus devriesei]RIL72058.1 glycosyltransferase family 4 protein [Staphylococcus devriesei]